jgi:hypothetical protein
LSLNLLEWSTPTAAAPATDHGKGKERKSSCRPHRPQ